MDLEEGFDKGGMDVGLDSEDDIWIRFKVLKRERRGVSDRIQFHRSRVRF